MIIIFSVRSYRHTHSVVPSNAVYEIPSRCVPCETFSSRYSDINLVTVCNSHTYTVYVPMYCTCTALQSRSSRYNSSTYTTVVHVTYTVQPMYMYIKYCVLTGVGGVMNEFHGNLGQGNKGRRHSADRRSCS
uniref:Uncharacterized protein n=1 Tax=Sipha flava TaxID=143950 RepID=A0A2S2Q951_9HEMI